MSPITEISGWPGMVRSFSTDDPPGPVALGAGGPGQRLGHRRRLHARGPQHGAGVVAGLLPGVVAHLQPAPVDVGDERAHVLLDPELLQDLGGPAGQLRPEARQRRAAAVEQQDPGVAPARCCGTRTRSVLVASSRICPASSTPVGPAPTRANVSQLRRSAGSAAVSAISNAPYTRRRIASASAIVFMPGAQRANSSMAEIGLPDPGGHDEVVVAVLEAARRRPAAR